MDDYNGVDRLLFFEQYLKRLRSEKEDFFKETLERLLSTTLELPFVEECRKLYIKERKPKKSGKCFGAPLNMYQFERLDPLIQTIRIDIHKEGLFRKPGATARKKELRRILDSGEKPPTEINVNDACDLIKIFFRELPQNVFPEEHFATHISISDMNHADGTEDKRRRIQTLQALYLCLPDVNRIAIRILLQLLHSTARRQEENKMSASSLATIFLPALLPQVVEHGSSAGITKLSHHITFMIRHARKIIMPPIEIVNLVQKFYPDCLKNMPPAPPASGKSRPGAKKTLSTRLKDSIVNFVSPKKGRRAPIRDANSISHTLLFRSGSADWTSSPKALDRQCRSKSEKILNRKSIFGSRSDIADSDELPSTSTTANSEYSKFREMHSKETASMGSMASLLSSAASNDIFDEAKADCISRASIDYAEKSQDELLSEEPTEEPQMNEESKISEESTEDYHSASVDEILDEDNPDESSEHSPSVTNPQIPSSTSGSLISKKPSASSLSQYEESTTKSSMKECLDESTLEAPDIRITSIADLVRMRQQHKAESSSRRVLEPVSENSPSRYSPKPSMKRESPTHPNVQREQKLQKTEEKTTVTLPRPIVRARNSPGLSSYRRDLRRNSSTRMGPLAAMSIRQVKKETIL
ncbi:Oidioi.mRNA.OKI2018_I69.PAR.g12021.t1.cds [Oikopleura dioica]|uniref:Oidioi.mRNA.OKI2018_I69.PAR.g12021.t1.cds n=1 Tax=Oikopleura dioica TaxID=34765 RepID=A0ABN7RYY7_OIKDI|nr:Oidioi.mRNA.OKI2018_I69.PAR.g12021.t1.cds [Oikopleura dioica]